MKLFIVAFCLLLAATNGFQPLLATKIIRSKVATPTKKVVKPKAVYNPRPPPSIKRSIMKKVAASKKSTIKKNVVKKVAPKKTDTMKPPFFKNFLFIAPTAPPTKKIAKKIVIGDKKGLVAPETKWTLKFFSDKL